MKIKKLDIYGYGKWVDKSFEIDEKLQLFYGPNEAGKSTLQSFIRSILFGFPTKHRRVNQLNRYEPKLGSRYGGRILLMDTPEGDLWIERTDSKFSIHTVDGEEKDPALLETLLSGLDERLFDTFYAFNLQNLQELSQLDTEQINDYFLSIGTVGSDQFVKIAKSLEKETDDFYRPQAQNRPLNLLLSEYDQLAYKVEAAKETMEQYDQLLQKRQDEEKTIAELNANIKELDNSMRELDKLIGRYDIFIKDRATVRELDQLVFTKIEDEMPEKIKQANRDISDNHSEIRQLEEKIELIRGELGTMTRLNWAVNHEEERKVWLSKTQQAKDIQAKIEYAQARIDEQEKLMHELAARGQFYPERVADDNEYQLKLESGLDIQSKKIDLAKQEDNLKSERKVYLEQRKEQQHYSAIIRSQVAKLENQRMNDEAVLIEETSLKHYLMGVVFLFLGLMLMGSQLINSVFNLNFLFWLGTILTVIGLVSSLYVFFDHRKRFNIFHNSPIVSKIQELREKESDYQEQSKAISIQINQRDEALEKIVEEREEVNKALQKWLVSIGFYPTADPELVLKTNPVKAYFEAQSVKEKFIEEKEHNLQLINDWRALLQPLFERFPFDDESVRAQIRYVEELEAQLKVTQFRGQNLNDRITEAETKIEQLKQKVTDDQALIDDILATTNSQNQLIFFDKVRDNERILELTEKHELYQQQMAGFEEALAEVVNKQALVEDYKRLEAKMELTREQLVPHHSERANLEVAIRNLESDGTYQNLTQQLAIKEAEVREAVLEWTSKRIAMELIFKTLRYGIGDPVPAMIERANEIFERLSYGRYTQIKLNKQGVKVMQFSGILFEPHELSQGTLEQLYVALRLAFVESATSMVKLPIIIDDAFVNFDEFRKTSMYQVLEQFSETTQVLFFTFDQQAIESFREEQTINLSEIEQVEEKAVE